jgi:peptidyl-prolyl cis-trans isomerase A (cyclophilin A)
MRRALFLTSAALTIAGALAPWAAAGQPAALLKPAALNERAPNEYRARFETRKGAFVVEVHRAWAPLAADRFYNLVKSGFYDNCRFFRVIDSVLVQVGIHGNPTVQAAWASAFIPDEPPRESNRRGYVALASAGAGSRATQFFVNLADNARFDRAKVAPFGRVTEGMDVLDALYSGYGEGAPRGQGPEQGRIQAEGNAYLKKEFPKLDFIRKATIEK